MRYIILIIFLAVIAIFSFKMMAKGEELPEFSLTGIDGKSIGLEKSDFKGQLTLLNFAASWCGACKYEHPLMVKLSKQKTLSVYGVMMSDQKESVIKWLRASGNPYAKIGLDLRGDFSRKLGVKGIPETMVISPEYEILFRRRGVLTKEVLANEILPIIKNYSN